MNVDSELIESKLKQSLESIEEARLLFDHQHYNSAISHLYYALFYAALAALYKNGIVAKTHSGVKGQFHLVFVKSLRIDEKHGKLYDNLMGLRSESDYGDFVAFEKEEVQPMFKEVTDFVHDVTDLVKRNK